MLIKYFYFETKYSFSLEETEHMLKQKDYIVINWEKLELP